MTMRTWAMVGSVLCAMTGYACGGANDSDVSGTPNDGALAPPGNAPGGSDTNGAAPSGSSGGGSSSSSGGGSSGTTGGDGGAGSGTGSGTGTGSGAGGAKCQAGDVAEKESNDTAETATAMPGTTGSFCGTLATATDVDHATFTLPPNAKSIGFHGSWSMYGVGVQISVDGKTFDVSQTPEVKPGLPYTIKVSTTGAAPADYRVSVTIGL